MIKQQYKIHPIANLFPSMTDVEYQALKKDIELNGQFEDAVFWRQQLVDGRHRARACAELGIELGSCELDDDDDPYVYVISANLHRRHLTTSQRSVVAAKMANLKHGQRKSELSNDNSNGDTKIQDAADLLNVGKASVCRAKSVLDKGSAKLIEAVERGEVAVSQAAKLVDVEPSKVAQTQIVSDGKVKETVAKVQAVTGFDRLMKEWKKATAAERKAFLAEVS